jgi:uncharacterized membrane protein YgaE (UPF0421/DUF939 family)
MGIRVIKTAVAAVLAVYLAKWIGLGSPYSAGLLAILGVDVTKRRGIRSATARLAASVLGLFFAALLFKLAGYSTWVLGLFVLVVYPLLARVKLQDGIITSTVVMLHLFAAKSATTQSIANEVLLLLVGLGTATVINVLYMPKSERRLEPLKEAVEDRFSAIFMQMAAHLNDHEHIWDGMELLEAGDLVRDGVEESKRMKENMLLFQRDDYWVSYFEMRRQQLEAITRMLDLLARVYETLPHSREAAVLFEGLSGLVKQSYYTGQTEEQLRDLEGRFQRMPLPASRSEFEVRAALLQLLYELKAYLGIARRLKRPKEDRRGAVPEKL